MINADKERQQSEAFLKAMRIAHRQNMQAIATAQRLTDMNADKIDAMAWNVPSFSQSSEVDKL